MYIVGNSLYTKVYQFVSNKNKNKEFINIFSAKSVSKLMKNVNQFLTNIDVTNYEVGKNEDECRKKLKGDIGELFALIWLQFFGSIFHIINPKLTSRDYKGVDFVAGCVEGGIVVIQSKFYNHTNEIKSGELETMYIQASNLRPEKIILFTTLPQNKISARYTSYENKNTLIIDCKIIDKYYKQKGVYSQFHQIFKESFE